MAKLDVPSPSRAHIAADYIADLAREASPGERLGSKSELRERVGVSVGTFNEALRLLQARHVVTMRPGPNGGVFAAQESAMIRLGNAVLALDSSDPAMVASAARIRDALEPLILEDATLHADRVQMTKMREELEEMRRAAEAVNPGAFIQANWSLHRTIAATSPSELLREMYEGAMAIVKSHTVSVVPADEARAPETLRKRFDVHVDLVNAIETGDLDAGNRALQRHRE